MKSITLTCTTGRSGTQKLAALLKTVPNMSADHEDEVFPSFGDSRRLNLADRSAGREFTKQFLKYVDDLPGEHFARTDLATSKGMFEHLIDLNVKPNVIILRRDARLTARGLFRLDIIPYRTQNAEYLRWFPWPCDPDSLPLNDYKKAHSYQYAYWYCCDCEHRAQHYIPYMLANGCKIWETTLTECLDLNHFNDMLDHFSLPNVDSVSQDIVDQYTLTRREIPPREFLYPLELDVLDRIPVDFKNNLLERGWGQP